jgi:hypothetical protein
MCTGSHPFIPVAKTAQAEVVFSINGVIAENVLHFHNDAGWDATSIQALADSIEVRWTADMLAVQSEDLVPLRVQTKDLSAPDSFYGESNFSGGAHGLVTSLAMPGNVTAAVKFTTGLTGRSNRGRAFHVGLAESQCVGNALEPLARIAILDAWELFVAEVHDDGYNLTVVSLCHDGVWRTVGVEHLVTAISVDPNIDSMRRRLTGRGQ